MRLQEPDLDFLNRVAKLKHPPLELGQRVSPRRVARPHQPNTVHHRVNELVKVRAVRLEIAHHILNIRLGGVRNALLIRQRGIVLDRVKNVRLRRILERNNILSRHLTILSQVQASSGSVTLSNSESIPD